MIVENLSRDIEQFEDRFVGDGIKDVQTVFSARHYVAAAQYTELLGQRALLDAKSSAQFIYANLPTAQSIKDANPERMRQRLEELCLELRQFRHTVLQYLYIAIYLSRMGLDWLLQPMRMRADKAAEIQEQQQQPAQATAEGRGPPR